MNWCKQKSIPDPCENQEGYPHIVSCFIQNLILETNCSSQIIRGYVDSINNLFLVRNFLPPIDFTDKQDINVKLINAVKCEEEIANQRSQITNKMFLAMCKNASKTAKDSINNVVFNFFCLIRVCGFRVAEYAQTTKSKIDFHEYPSGIHLTKAFLPTDWVFRGAKNASIKVHLTNNNCKLPKQLKISFRTQMNRQNGQSITVLTDDEHPKICSI
jgi:hypothetical protein